MPADGLDGGRRDLAVRHPGPELPRPGRAVARGARAAARSAAPARWCWRRPDIGLYVGGLTRLLAVRLPRGRPRPRRPRGGGRAASTARPHRPSARPPRPGGASRTSSSRRACRRAGSVRARLSAARGSVPGPRGALAVWSRDGRPPAGQDGLGNAPFAPFSAPCCRMGPCRATPPARSSRSRPRRSASSSPASTRASTARSRRSSPARAAWSPPAWARAGSSRRRSPPPSPPPARPSLFLHPAEAIHGDLGRIVKGDVLLAVSNSGDTEEILALVPWVKRLGSPVVALTGNARSPLAQAADVHLDVAIRAEACPLGLAPTASTTAALAMGDALSMALARAARLHRRGLRGAAPRRAPRQEAPPRRGPHAHRGRRSPGCGPETPMKDVLFEMTRKRLGLTTVTAEDGTLLGMISDGDLRRQMERHGYALLDRKAAECMTRSPVLVGRRELATTALDLLETPQDHLAPRDRRAGPRGGRPPPARPLEDGDDLAAEMTRHRARRRPPRRPSPGCARGGRVGGGRGGAGRAPAARLPLLAPLHRGPPLPRHRAARDRHPRARQGPARAPRRGGGPAGA